MVTPRRLNWCSVTETRVLARVDQIYYKQLRVVTLYKIEAVWKIRSCYILTVQNLVYVLCINFYKLLKL